MPKMKTHKGCKKRFKVTAKGKLKHRRAGGGHLMSCKSPKRRRNISSPTTTGGKVAANIKVMLGA